MGPGGPTGTGQVAAPGPSAPSATAQNQQMADMQKTVAQQTQTTQANMQIQQQIDAKRAELMRLTDQFQTAQKSLLDKQKEIDRLEMLKK